MALWGSDDNLASVGEVSLAWDATAKNNAGAWVVTNSGNNFASGDVGKVIRFGIRGDGGTYYGDAAIDSYISVTKVSIASTSGLSDVSIADTSYYKSDLPSYTIGDSSYSETNSGYDKIVYGIGKETSQAYGISTTSAYRTSGSGWVGVTTYVDGNGRFRVKSETLVATSGISTGTNGIQYHTAEI